MFLVLINCLSDQDTLTGEMTLEGGALVLADQVRLVILFVLWDWYLTFNVFLNFKKNLSEIGW